MANKIQKAKLANNLKKIETFLDLFKKDPTQSVTLLCKQLNLPKSQLYEYLRSNNIVLNDIRENKDIEGENVVAQKEERGKPGVRGASIEEMQELIAKVDELKAQGYSVKDAMEKCSDKYFRTYYTYRSRLQEMKDGKKPTRSYKRKDKKDIIPSTPHTIEYVKVEKKNKSKELVMMIGSPDVLYDFIKKMRGSSDDE